MAISIRLEKASLFFDAAFDKPEFALFRDTPGLLDRLFHHLAPHGLRLNDLRVERGANSAGDFHVLCYLFNFWMTVRVRVDRIEVVCSEFPNQFVERFKAAIFDAVRAVQEYRPDLSFRAFGAAWETHGKLEGQSAKDYLARFAANVPGGLGPLTGNGAVFYFGPESDRLLCTITADASALVSDGLYLRIQCLWDAKKVSTDDLGATADAFVRQAIDRLGLQVSQ